MPLPLAHPAAVLPFRRFCPRFLSFPALVIGSIIPDAGYITETTAGFSHGFLGILFFCLPAGVVLGLFLGTLEMWLLAGLGGFSDLTRHFGLKGKAGARQAMVFVFSLLLGALTHNAWDAFTNNSGFFVLHLPLLQAPIMRIAGHQVRVCHLLWYASTFVGVAALSMTFYMPLRHDLTPGAPDLLARVRKALICGSLALPIGVVHHLAPKPMSAVLVVALSLGMATILVNRQRVEQWIFDICSKHAGKEHLNCLQHVNKHAGASQQISMMPDESYIPRSGNLSPAFKRSQETTTEMSMVIPPKLQTPNVTEEWCSRE